MIVLKDVVYKNVINGLQVKWVICSLYVSVSLVCIKRPFQDSEICPCKEALHENTGNDKIDARSESRTSCSTLEGWLHYMG